VRLAKQKNNDHVPMTENTSKDMTVLFADVAGSVDLYTALGDVQAHRRIVNFLQSMTVLIESNQGRVVETIGDEIMCAFNDTNSALTAACAIQESLQNERKWGVNVRVGMHSGRTCIENDHPFGDTVNVAARVVALAKAGQIMLTDYAYQRLTEANKSRTRYFSEVYIKGKPDPYVIHQALSDQEDGTVMVKCNVTKPVERRRKVGSFHLRYRDRDAELTEGAELLLGRGEQCGLRIDSQAASRIHATLKCQGGRLILTDRSTNGTFVRTLAGKRSSDNSELFFHHGEWMTTGGGYISLGRPVSTQNTHLLRLSCS
jgi:class 3 adenylate cyclase